MTTDIINLNYPRIVSRAEWLQARLALLAREKSHTRERDSINQARRELPMVRVERDYVFAGSEGPKRFIELFAGRRQLIVYHFMWHWEKGRALDEPCRGCAGWVDQLSRGIFNGLHSRNTTLVIVTRAPQEKIRPFWQRMGWTVPVYSSAGSSFNFDFGVSIDASVAPVAYNYRTAEEHEKAGTGYLLNPDQPFDLHGLSCFLRQGDEVFHTYSTYGRGCESTGGSYYFLDLTALGRQEDREQPKGRAAGKGLPPRPDLNPYPDEYVA
jgi:predicted dithiol-disulfide oxidoreductase (DUF899 family)